MLKRDGKPIQTPEGHQLASGEEDAFNDAFDAIRDELESLEINLPSHPKLDEAAQAQTKNVRFAF